VFRNAWSGEDASPVAGWLGILARYVTPIALVASALTVALALQQHAAISPFPLLMTAVMVTACVAGRGAAFLAIALSVVAIDYFFEYPLYSLEIVSLDTAIKLAVFVLAALLIGLYTRRLEEARRQAEAARVVAERTKNELAQILHRIDDGFLAVDSEGRFAYVNPQAIRLLLPDNSLVTSADLLGKPIREILPARTGMEWEAAQQRAAAEQRIITFEEYYPRLQRWVEFRVYGDEHGISVFCRESRHSWTQPLAPSPPAATSSASRPGG
jgi:K+-sensing histidine kinase KdpD